MADMPLEDPNIAYYRDRLLAAAEDALPATDLPAIAAAAAFAITAHGAQRRLSGLPYVTHPLETGRKLAVIRLPRNVIIAGILHDTHEDAGTSREDIARQFGDDVAGLVVGVTKVGKVQYRGEERYIENLRKMFVAIARDIRVIFIKFADRLHNLEDLGVVPEPKRTRIARESLEIHAPIANRLGMGEIKAQLEDLAFPYVHPEEAAWVDTLVAPMGAKREQLRAEVHAAAVTELTRDRIPYTAIDARTKSRYSLYQKLLRYDRDIERIHDLVALRIIVPSVTDCYAALSAIHQRWKPLKGRIKDYIANPKSNGYQSIHTTVAYAPEATVEFQIRTAAMHEDAEWGAAAAWRYHERGSVRPSPRQLRWVEQLIEWQRGIHDPKEFIEGLKFDILKDRILVFTPKGDVIELPEGATPLDFAYAIHTDIGHHATGARVNGATALHPLGAPLRNGDMIEILMDPKRNGPSRDWLGIVRTTHARSKIRDALRGNVRTSIARWIERSTGR